VVALGLPARLKLLVLGHAALDAGGDGAVVWIACSRGAQHGAADRRGDALASYD
jgi:hypothetical protein